MISASWIVTVEPRRKLLRLAITGFFTPPDVLAFAQEVSVGIAKLRPYLGGQAHLTLCDTRGVQIQSQEAVRSFSDMLAHPAARSRRLAYVVDAALAQIQIKRLTDRVDAAYFRDLESAETWLFE